MRMVVLAAHVTGWSYAELMDLDLQDLRCVMDLSLDVGLLKRER